MTSRRRLRSSASHRLEVPLVWLSTVGKRAFPVDTGANMWNDLPFHITSTQSLAGLQTSSQDFPLLSFLPGHPDMTYLSLLIIIIAFFFYSGIFQWPCNNWHYLGHVKHVDDDDDDDDDDEIIKSYYLCMEYINIEQIIKSCCFYRALLFSKSLKAGAYALQ